MADANDKIERLGDKVNKLTNLVEKVCILRVLFSFNRNCLIGRPLDRAWQFILHFSGLKF
jgi:hypothetical protein